MARFFSLSLSSYIGCNLIEARSKVAVDDFTSPDSFAGERGEGGVGVNVVGLGHSPFRAYVWFRHAWIAESLISLIPQNGQTPQRFQFIQRAQRSGLRPLRAGFVVRVVGAFPRKIQIPFAFRHITAHTLAGIGNP